MTVADPKHIALYVHLPWCVAKCPYCDFNSHPIPKAQAGIIASTGLEADYTAALLADLTAELAELDSAQVTISSVFFGGGTPSLFGPATFGALLDRCAPWLSADAEVTLEANPGTQEYADFAGYRAAGINRVSLGAQSFDDQQLKRLGRVHQAAETRRAYDKVRAAGIDRINLDLMYALPNQTAAAAVDDLTQGLALGPEHLSWYQLTLEPKTEFGARPPPLPAEDQVEAMEEAGYALLAAAGLRRYEVSAYARAGETSQHNLRYWTFGDYLGVGAGAHGKQLVDGTTIRRSKPSQPRLYLKDPLSKVETLVSPSALPGEFAMNVLRLVDGVDPALYAASTGQAPAALDNSWRAMRELGLMSDGRFQATAQGYRYLNNVVAAFVEQERFKAID